MADGPDFTLGREVGELGVPVWRKAGAPKTPDAGLPCEGERWRGISEGGRDEEITLSRACGRGHGELPEMGMARERAGGYAGESSVSVSGAATVGLEVEQVTAAGTAAVICGDMEAEKALGERVTVRVNDMSMWRGEGEFALEGGSTQNPETDERSGRPRARAS